MSETELSNIERRLDDLDRRVKTTRRKLKSIVKRVKELEACSRAGSPEPITPGSAQGSPSPNTALLAALREVEEIQREMNPTKVSPTQQYLEEARAGAMYGDRNRDDSDPDHD